MIALAANVRVGTTDAHPRVPAGASPGPGDARSLARPPLVATVSGERGSQSTNDDLAPPTPATAPTWGERRAAGTTWSTARETGSTWPPRDVARTTTNDEE